MTSPPRGSIDPQRTPSQAVRSFWGLVVAGAIAGCSCTLRPLEPVVPSGDAGTECTPVAELETLCFDGLDNDCDGKVDRDDPECEHELCDGGSCSCNPGTCGGCCSGATCATPSFTRCGADGGACVACNPMRANQCNAGQCACGASPQCGPDEQCIGGACCPAASACGSSCCGAGEACFQGVCCPSTSLMPQVQAFFNSKCANCHPNNHSPNLQSGSSRAALINQNATGQCGPPASNGTSWKLVVPGDLGNSVLARYVQPCPCGTSCLSPPCGSGLRCGSGDPICTGRSQAPSAADQRNVQCWILQGAPP